MHIGLIMDGNRRWAQDNGYSLYDAYHKGLENLLDLLEVIKEKQEITAVTVFALSRDNMGRSAPQTAIFTTLADNVAKQVEEKVDPRFCIKFKGDLKPFPQLQPLSRTRGTIDLNICLNYDWKTELLQAYQRVQGEVTPEKLSQQIGPDIDLIIRTGGVQRISGFCCWQSSYSELFFSTLLWPDFHQEHLEEALHWYSAQNRKFGS